MSLLILTNGKSKSYDIILVIINQLIMYYKSIKIIDNITGLGKVFADVVLQYYDFFRLNHQ